MTWYKGKKGGGSGGEFVLFDGQCSTTSAYLTASFSRSLVSGRQYIVSYKFATTPQTQGSSRIGNGGGFLYGGSTQTVRLGEATFTITATTIKCTYSGSWSNMWVRVFEVDENAISENAYYDT